MICAWMFTSSAEIGSSPTTNTGSTASARAIEMRWRWPPENSCGNRAAASGGSPTRFSSSPTRVARHRPRRCARPCSRSGPARISPTVMRGLSEAYGSWKIICIRRRNGRIADCDACEMSWPSNTMRPAVGSSSRITSRASVDLPQPDFAHQADGLAGKHVADPRRRPRAARGAVPGNSRAAAGNA